MFDRVLVSRTMTGRSAPGVYGALCAGTLGIVVFLLTTMPATATSPYGPAILGGMDRDWLHALGPSISHSTSLQMHWQRCPNEQTDRLIATLDDHHVMLITRHYCESARVPSYAARYAALAPYLPQGARRLGTMIADGSGRQALYISRTLARIYPTGLYLNCSGSSVAAGTFSVSLGQPGDMVIDAGVGACN